MGDETRVQVREFKKGVEAATGIAERYLIRWLGPLGRKISEANKTGRTMALIGAVVMVVSLVLIVADALSVWTAARKGHSYFFIRFEMKGYGIPFLIGLGLMIAGAFQRKR